jgi:hypothetical protein
MQTIPLQPTPSQSLSIVLANQNCQINVYQKTTGMFLDLAVSNVAIIDAVICLDRVRMVREKYLGFIGDLAFVDTQGVGDPVYSSLGSRYQLIYLEAADL